MSKPEPERPPSLLAELIEPEGRFLPRLRGVFRFDAEVYTEIAGDANAIPQSFAVVIATAVIAGLGQPWLAGLFIRAVEALFAWMLASALIWLAATLALGRAPDFPRLLRCLGFAYAWAALMFLAGLPWIGGLFELAAPLLCFASAVLATRQVLEVSTQRAAAICVAPLVLLALLAFC